MSVLSYQFYFLPLKLLNKLKISKTKEKYSKIIILIFFISFYLFHPNEDSMSETSHVTMDFFR